MTNPVISLPLRDHQRTVKQSTARFKVPVMHRRAGKSVLFVAALMEAASKGQPGEKYHYVGPSIKQTKAIAWDYAQRIAARIGGCKISQSELKITCAGGGSVELLGVENIDSLRGRYSNGIALDEAQLMPSSHWAYVIRPLLADRQGWAMIGGTPAGKHNLLGWGYHTAPELSGWERFLFKIGDTDLLASDREQMRQEMSPQAWAQEMDCSFTAAIQGAFFAEQCDALVADNRLTTVRHDASLPVTVSLDLGHDDLMPVIWQQYGGTEHRIIRVETYRRTSIPDMVSHWKHVVELPIDHVILPHDARVRELGSGATREEVFGDLGYTTSIAPKQSHLEAIEACRRALPHVWIDEEHAGILFEALAGYHAKHDDTTGVARITPEHSWHSHYADAFKYLVLGDHKGFTGFGARPTASLGIYA